MAEASKHSDNSEFRACIGKATAICLDASLSIPLALAAKSQR
jgi:hypothetical protein